MDCRIFDCFTFFNEIDLLEVRFEELYDVVDYFVICEASVTFQGKQKPLYFAENKQRFSKYLDKVIHIILNDLPDTGNPWDREFAQRDALAAGCNLARPGDLVLVSDADEIYRRDVIQNIRGTDGYIAFDMPMFQYYLNLRAEPSGWSRAFGFTWKYREKLRNFTSGRIDKELLKETFGHLYHEIQQSGWHFTYLGGAEKIRTKLQSFSHTEEWFKVMLSEGGIEDQVALGGVVGNFWHLAEYINIDHSFPIHIQNRVNYFKQIGFIRDIHEAYRELQIRYRDVREKLKEQISINSQIFISKQISDGIKSDHETVSSRTVSNNRFENIISIGTYCTAAAHLREAGLRRASFPFDWIFSNPSMIADCFEDDFSNFLNRNYLIPIEDGSKCQHAFYQEKYSMPHGAIFNHQNVADNAEYQKLSRRVDRLRQAISNKDKTLLLMMINTSSFYEDIAGTIFRIKRAANDCPIFVVVFSQSYAEPRGKVEIIFKNTEIIIAKLFVHSDTSDGLLFDDRQDTEAVIKFLHNLNRTDI